MESTAPGSICTHDYPESSLGKARLQTSFFSRWLPELHHVDILRQTVPPEEGVHIVQEGRRNTFAWTFFSMQGVGDMLFERLSEPVDALRSRNNTLRNLAAFHVPREFIFLYDSRERIPDWHSSVA